MRAISRYRRTDERRTFGRGVLSFGTSRGSVGSLAGRYAVVQVGQAVRARIGLRAHRRSAIACVGQQAPEVRVVVVPNEVIGLAGHSLLQIVDGRSDARPGGGR